MWEWVDKRTRMYFSVFFDRDHSTTYKYRVIQSYWRSKKPAALETRCVEHFWGGAPALSAVTTYYTI